MATKEPQADPRQRIDKWLFFARIVKSRSLAQLAVEAGAVSINGTVCDQPSRMVRAGDRIEVTLERRDLVVVVKAAGERRGPFEEARLLYEDVTPAELQVKILTPYEKSQRMLRGRPKS